MPKSLVLGNGNMLVCIDKNAQVRDLYFPHVGLENHVGGHYTHRIGVWVDDRFSWLSDPEWKINIESKDNALEGDTTAIHHDLGIKLRFSDIVYNEKNIFVRSVSVRNVAQARRKIKIFFGHEFEIYESHRGDTAYFDPMRNAIVHYNGKRVFLINARCENKPIDDYTTGIFHIYGKEGSYKDAENGALSKNAIEHGPVDSVFGIYRDFDPEEEKVIQYWIAVGQSIKEVQDLNDYVIERTPDHLLRTTHDYWNAWVNKIEFNFHDLDERAISLFRKSLFMIRAHSDNHGAIIASGDSDMLQKGKDTYSYMWPRDAAFSARALDMAGDVNVAQRFFRFCDKIITDDGYFMHKYRSDGSLGSSWHPWIRNGKVELPIQEDETALVVYALWQHYEISKDLEFIESVYNSLIKKAADFMVTFRDERTGLPRPSYDLWEEKFGVSTFTASTVYGALTAAAHFAELLGKNKSAEQYKTVAEEIRGAILRYLYNEDEGVFYKMVTMSGSALPGEHSIDSTIDMSSVYGVFAFGVLPPDDERLVKAVKKTEERLLCKTAIGGVARYEGDSFYRTSSSIPGNPWIITSLWLAQFSIARARTENDFAVAKGWINWVVDHALHSGILSEQLDTFSGERLSATPLTWSHAEFVITVIQYLDKLEELGLCVGCDPLHETKRL